MSLEGGSLRASPKMTPQEEDTMRQGITTHYRAPTNTKGSRIKAIARKGSTFGRAMTKTIPLDHSLTLEGRHLKAAQALATELEWSGLWIAGGSPDEDGYQYVNVEGRIHEALDAEVMRKHFGREGQDWFIVP